MRNVCTTMKKIIPAIVSTVLALTGAVSFPASAAETMRAELTGVSFTDSETLAALVYETQAGNCNLYEDEDHTIPAILPLDSVYSTSQKFYLLCGTSPMKTWGKQCYIYAQGVFAHLFDEMPAHGPENSYSFHHCISVMGSSPEVSFSQFLDSRVMPGAYLRTTNQADGKYSGSAGHSLIILGYNQDSVTIQEGNAFGGGEIRLATMDWDRFNRSFLSGKGRYVSHIVQPREDYYLSQFGLSYDFSKENQQVSYEPEQLLLRRLGSGLRLSLPTTAKPDDYVWTSSDEQIATVDPSGNVTVHEDGNVTIQAEDANAIYSFDVTVDAVEWEKIGDVDGNGTINCDDSTAILLTYLNDMMEGSDVSAEEFALYDIDNDGNITADDATLVLHYYLSNAMSGGALDAETLWKEILA